MDGFALVNCLGKPRTNHAHKNWSRAKPGLGLARRRGLGSRDLGPLAAGPQPQGGRSQPNVIVILTDDQGYGDLSAHGNPILQTTEPRPAPRRERPSDELPCSPGLHPDPQRVDDGPILAAEQGRHGAGWPESNAAGRPHHARDLRCQWLRHRPVREMAPGRHLSPPPTGPGLPACRLAQGLGTSLGD